MTFLSIISQGEASHYQAQVASNQARVARSNAQYAAGATASNTEAAGLRARAQTSMVGAAEGANNLTATGSAADTITSTREMGDFDTANTANRGALQTYGYEQQEVGDLAESKLDQGEASEAYWAAPLSLLGQEATAMPQVPGAMQWMQQTGGGTLEDGEESGVSDQAASDLSQMQGEDAAAEAASVLGG